MIQNIFCVGRNYREHALELDNPVPEHPLIFSKPTNSIVQAKGQKVFYPNIDGEIHYEIEVVLKISKDVGREAIQTDDIIGEMALGIDFTKRDVQTTLKEKGHPWLLAKGFKNATVLTDFWRFPGEKMCNEKAFSLVKNGNVVQKGNTSQLIFSFKHLLEYIHEHFELRQGDIIFTGTPEGVGPICDGDHFQLYWGKELKGSFEVRME